MANKLKEKMCEQKLLEYQSLVNVVSQLYLDAKSVELFYDISNYKDYSDFCEGLKSLYSSLVDICGNYILSFSIAKSSNLKTPVIQFNNFKEIKLLTSTIIPAVYTIRYELNMDYLEKTLLPNYRNERVFMPLTTSPFPDFQDIKLPIASENDTHYFEDFYLNQLTEDCYTACEILNHENKQLMEQLSLPQNESELYKIMNEPESEATKKQLKVMQTSDQILLAMQQISNLNRCCEDANVLLKSAACGEKESLAVKEFFDKIKLKREEQVAQIYKDEENFLCGNAPEFNSPTEWAINRRRIK